MGGYSSRGIDRLWKMRYARRPAAAGRACTPWVEPRRLFACIGPRRKARAASARRFWPFRHSFRARLGALSIQLGPAATRNIAAAPSPPLGGGFFHALRPARPPPPLQPRSGLRPPPL